MAKYVDGFVIVIPKNKKAVYMKMAQEGAEVWKKYGALEYFECISDDLNPKSMGGPKPLGFKKMTKLKPTENVWFSFIVYNSKKHKEEVNAKVMKYFQEKYADSKDFEMPFDIKRMASGGFDVVVEG